MIIPDWAKTLKPTSLLSSNEVAVLLGIKVKALYNRIERNSFPKADRSISNSMFGKNCKPRSYWYVKTVINHINGIGKV
jgi:predicted DNA-binding transcriptional regulator AlpA